MRFLKERSDATVPDDDDRADEEDGDLARDYKDWPSSFNGNGWKRMGGEL